MHVFMHVKEEKNKEHIKKKISESEFKVYGGFLYQFNTESKMM